MKKMQKNNQKFKKKLNKNLSSAKNWSKSSKNCNKNKWKLIRIIKKKLLKTYWKLGENLTKMGKTCRKLIKNHENFEKT